jgi:hypothetical protein
LVTCVDGSLAWLLRYTCNPGFPVEPGAADLSGPTTHRATGFGRAVVAPVTPGSSDKAPRSSSRQVSQLKAALSRHAPSWGRIDGEERSADG